MVIENRSSKKCKIQVRGQCTTLEESCRTATTAPTSATTTAPIAIAESKPMSSESEALLSIVTVAAGSYHAWLGGSDIDNPLTWLIAGAGSAIVVLLVAVRLRRAGNRHVLESREPNIGVDDVHRHARSVGLFLEVGCLQHGFLQFRAAEEAQRDARAGGGVGFATAHRIEEHSRLAVSHLAP